MDVRIRNANTFKSVMEIEEEEVLHCLSKEFERLPQEWRKAIVRGKLNYKRKEATNENYNRDSVNSDP